MFKIIIFISLLVFSCTSSRENKNNYFQNEGFKVSIRQWDTFIYNQDTSEFYYGTSMWSPEGGNQNAQLEYINGKCKVLVYKGNKDSGLFYSGYFKAIKGENKSKAPFTFYPFRQYVLYEDSVWYGYGEDGSITSKFIYEYRNDTLFEKRLKFDTIADFEVQPYPFIGSRNMIYEDKKPIEAK